MAQHTCREIKIIYIYIWVDTWKQDASGKQTTSELSLKTETNDDFSQEMSSWVLHALTAMLLPYICIIFVNPLVLCLYIWYQAAGTFPSSSMKKMADLGYLKRTNTNLVLSFLNHYQPMVTTTIILCEQTPEK
jgi:hypothetical protein